jgi:hypothetical protein
MAYRYIHTNPYIVGNPIKSKEMFFGREEDFKFIKEKLQQETRGIIITLAGERRSGKTSILFQIMNGRLGSDFLPFFIDMQTMADVNSNREFFQKIDDCVRKELSIPSKEKDFEGEGFKDFEETIIHVQESHSQKKLVLLFDEYELLENKIEKGQISQDVFMFFANLMENHNVLFIFSGSNKIKDQNPKYWKALFSKSIYRNISYLNKKDCMALITKPCEGFVNYLAEYVKLIYRLTAGQPFYTQIFCQNMVDWLKAEQRNDVLKEDLAKVIKDIIDHPIPQMIYFWNELSRNQKILLAIIAEIIQSDDLSTDSREVVKYLKANDLNHLITLNEIHGIFEELYHLEVLTKVEGEYQFHVDLFRFWIKQDQNIWKVINDYKSELPKPPTSPIKKAGIIASVVFLIPALILATKFFLLPLIQHDTNHQQAAISKDTVTQIKRLASDTINTISAHNGLTWWNEINFRNAARRSDKLSALAFDLILPKLSENKNAKYSESGHSIRKGINSEKFAEFIFRCICKNYIQPWNRKIVYNKTTSLKSGDLLIFKNGDHLFYFDGIDRTSHSNKKVAVGMTRKGIEAIGFRQDSILYLKSIRLEEYISPKPASLIDQPTVQLNRSILYDLGLTPNDDLYKILSDMINYQNSIENGQIATNPYTDDPQGFVSYLFSKAFKVKMPEPGTAHLQAGFQKWLRECQFRFKTVAPGNNFKTGDLVFYSIDGKEYTMFFLKKKAGPFVIGMTEKGVKMFRFDFSPNAGGIDINYFWLF